METTVHRERSKQQNPLGKQTITSHLAFVIRTSTLMLLSRTWLQQILKKRIRMNESSSGTQLTSHAY
jgi:hypothetical protein